ncbi:ABC transporter permease, partial [Pseudomonas syringae pv. syringae FF5]
MIGWALRRLTQSLLVVLLMTLVVFVGLNAIGNPMDILVGEDLNQAERLQAIAHLGLDQPLWQ